MRDSLHDAQRQEAVFLQELEGSEGEHVVVVVDAGETDPGKGSLRSLHQPGEALRPEGRDGGLDQGHRILEENPCRLSAAPSLLAQDLSRRRVRGILRHPGCLQRE